MNQRVLAGLCVLLMGLGLLVGCVPGYPLADTGFFGEHKLYRIERFGANEGSLHGTFFLGTGSINGTLGSEFKLQFYWEPKPGEIVVTTLPYSKFRFILDDSKEVPTVEFVLFDNYVGTRVADPNKVNLNTLTMNDSIMKVAIVRISKEALEKEVYLPKIN
jgi:hypothetical protein